MAQLHGHGPVLSEWPAAHLDCLVCAPIAARISRRFGHADHGAGAVADFRGVFSAALADHFVLRDYALADRHHSDQQLRFPELPGSGRSGFCCWTINSWPRSCPKIGNSPPVCRKTFRSRSQNGIRRWPGTHPSGYPGDIPDLDFLCDLGASYLHDVPSTRRCPALPSVRSNRFALPMSSDFSRS